MGRGVATILLGAVLLGQAAPAPRSPPRAAPDNGCVRCHAGIEDIHPGWPLSCVDCHGGDARATEKDRAHVLPSLPVPRDERVLPEHHDLAWQRFRNPSNLRVAAEVCGDCHGGIVADVRKSLHATTAGHLGDGFYEHGLSADKQPAYSVFPVRDEDGVDSPHAVASTRQVPPFLGSRPDDRISTHYADLPRKACMHCHLWSEGRAVDGRLGMDGDYRGEGCAACHVTYADDGRSRSADATIDRFEPGHPIEHRFTTKIPTETCTRCHYGDASIGLHYRGLAQLVPGMAAGPDVPNTTDRLLNGTFYIRDPGMTPPDVHHERGLHCIDCHGAADTMGDGDIHPQMDHAVEIECESCHGSIDRVSDLKTSHGRRVPNLRREGDTFWLVSKITGRWHRVVQAAHVVDPEHPDHRPRAAEAMTGDHARLECYACHAAWNVDFFGFHFDRNEQFTQLDLLSGRRTPGRVTTQEKVFATFNQLRLGFNHEGRIAPYMVGFSTIGSAHDEDGEPLLWQAVPETAAGLSGVTMIPHQTHSVRSETRTCVECHRTSVTYGTGSTNFRLAREFGVAVDGGGLRVLALDPKDLARTTTVAEVEIPGGPRAVALRLDPVHARATHAYVGCADGGLAVVDLGNPALPVLKGRRPELADPHRMLVRGRHLWVADGVGGVLAFDLRHPDRPERVGALATTDARALALTFPWLLVADGAGGLVTADVRDPARPRALAALDVNGESSAPNEAVDVAVLFHYSRTTAGDEGLERSRARHVAWVAAGLDGVAVVDFSEPNDPVLLESRATRRAFRLQRPDVRGVAVNTVFDVGSAGGGLDSREREYLYVQAVVGRGQRQPWLYTYDVSDLAAPRRVPRGAVRVLGATGELLLLRTYNAPFLQHFVAAVGAGGGVSMVDVSEARAGIRVATSWGDLPGIRDLALEELAFDRLQDEEGAWIVDISHPGCRYLDRGEMLRVLDVQLPLRAERRGRYGRVRGDPSDGREERR